MRPRGPGRWSLRSRLALTAAVLTACGLLAANGAGLFLLRSHLIAQVDERLGTMTSSVTSVTPQQIERLREILVELAPVRLSAGALDPQEFQLYFLAEEGARRILPPDDAEAGPDLPGRTALAGRAGDGPFTVSGTSGGSWRVEVMTLPGGFLALGASSLAEADTTFQRMLLINLVVMVGVLGALGLVARLVVGVGLRPLSRMEAVAAQIAAGDYARRVADADPHSEPGRLGRAINTMLDRVESEIGARKASEESMRRFLADASHELRTPLTSIRGFAELARWGGSADAALAKVEAEAARMGVLVDDLLLLARMDERRRLELAPVDLLALAAELVRDVHMRHPSRKVRLAGLDQDRAYFEPVLVRGDELRLRQIVGNLLDNAVRHTPEDASVTVRVGSARPGRAVVEVADTGPGVAPADAPHIFERFYRADRARSADGGTGLGLAIASVLTQAHEGRLELGETPGGGATFRLLLPIPSGL
ncbi:two-component system OmpR family sensor kinase [Actinocorallia herbida]|uniref:histidine kinase n=1 Tax=Actinocorallia herbida TaxID=58109 RepID=A0A3N1CZJ4_9ACTN|nr:HAMP domain-containing sensor histidine kinase [Actinocorallia herbida]ROO86704.1 two-component system OmpR family sensor kinase [Actinocorallia herbida]